MNTMSDASKNWFEIDRKDLATLIARRAKIVHERVSSAFDTDDVVRNQPKRR
jgi:hypothetical protein